MAWIASSASTRRSIRYVDDADPRKHADIFTLSALRFESQIDSGVFDTPINASPIRVDNAQFDGWRVTSNGWHYALGKDLANHGNEDGWVGFGGRKGQNWFKFRLENVGYLHWPTRSLDDIGGSPNYVRNNLSRATNNFYDHVSGSAYPVETEATWTKIWTTPGGGDLTVSWRASGDGLKEELRLNQAARAWIANNRPPSTSASETWFGFRFRLDWSDIPKAVRDGVLQDIEGDFADDGKGVELRDAQDRLLAFMPVDYAFVRDADGTGIATLALRKRIYKSGSDYFLLIGARVDQLVALPSGLLVFDPTLDLQISATADDANEKDNSTSFSATDTTVNCAANTAASSRWNGGFRFQIITASPGATIDVAYFQPFIVNTNNDSPHLDIFCENVDDAVNFTTTASVTGRARTTASTSWSQSNIGAGSTNSPDISPVIQQVIDRAGWLSGNDLVILVNGKSDAASPFGVRSRDGSAASAAKLHIEYTDGGGVTVTPDNASAKATVVAPSVILGSISYTPNNASAVAAKNDPTVVLGSISYSPGAATAIAAVVDPNVVLGSITYAPTNASALAAAVAPGVVLGSISFTPSSAEAVSTKTDPTVVLGSISITPSVATAVATVVDPTVSAGGDVTVAPNPATAVASKSDPTVVLGSITITPAAATAVASVTAPTVVLGSVSITPDVATSVATVTAPSVVLGSVTVTPTAIPAVATVSAPTVVLGSVTVTPNAATAATNTVNPTVVLGSVTITVAPATSVATSSVIIVLGSINVAPSAALAVAAVVAPSVDQGNVVLARDFINGEFWITDSALGEFMIRQSILGEHIVPQSESGEFDRVDAIIGEFVVSGSIAGSVD